MQATVAVYHKQLMAVGGALKANCTLDALPIAQKVDHGATALPHPARSIGFTFPGC